MLGEFIHSRRKELGLTQQALADKLGISNKAVSKWETFEANPELGLILPLAEALGITADELLSCKVKSSGAGEESAREVFGVAQAAFPSKLQRRQRRKETVQLVFGWFFFMLFLLLAVMSLATSIVALNPKTHTSTESQLIILVIFTLFTAGFGAAAVKLGRFVSVRVQRRTGFAPEVTHIGGYAVFQNLPKEQKRALGKRYLKENKRFFAVLIAGMTLIMAAIAGATFLQIPWLATAVYIPGYAAYFFSTMSSKMRRKNWFLKQGVIFSKDQLKKIQPPIDR